MNVLLIGSGGREHAMAMALSKSPSLGRLFAAPGNPGIETLATCLPIKVEDLNGIVAACRTHAVDFVVVGPEVPLVAGLVDRLADAGVKAFGPSAAAAQLEGSKGFTKDFCARHAIPTAAYRRCDSLETARAYLAEVGAPIVVKADGLAAGKGVTVAEDMAEAEAALARIFVPGSEGASAVLEEVLTGEEASFFALCDGTDAVAFASAQDHKRVGEGDTGPNTGGMGAYSPAPVVTPAVAARVMREIIRPTVVGMQAEGMPFSGVLFAGLMIGDDGPKLIEYNVRFGDPETQVMLPRFEGDFLALLLRCAEGRLAGAEVTLSSDAVLTVVYAARGYPDAPRRGGAIRGTERVVEAAVTHAGTRLVDGRLVADGGRVLNVTGRGASLVAAHDRAYDAIASIDFADGFYRRDIGFRALGSVADPRPAPIND